MPGGYGGGDVGGGPPGAHASPKKELSSTCALEGCSQPEPSALPVQTSAPKRPLRIRRR